MPNWGKMPVLKDKNDKYSNENNYSNPVNKITKILNHDNYRTGFAKSTEFLMEKLTDSEKIDILLKKQEKLEMYINIGLVILLFILLKVTK